MVAPNAGVAIARANATKVCEPGWCLKYTRTWLGIDPLYDDAEEAAQNAEVMHTTRNPRKGAPVFYQGGDHWHIALSLGLSSGKFFIRSTDRPKTGVVGNVPLDDPEKAWGFEFYGWSEDLNGVTIPYLGQSPYSTGTVYVEKLHRGQKDSDSVSRLRYRLQSHIRIPADVKPGYGNDWGPRVTKAVAYWQTKVAPQIHGPSDGSRMSNPQANALFGPAYVVVNETV